jgi:1,2-diacylglycerol 3-beta-galactosyltransferase
MNGMVLIDARSGRETFEPHGACGAADLLLPGRGTMAEARVPLLFLLADTGGGHRSVARAVSEALEEAYPGRFDPVLCDPLAGRSSSRLLRGVTRLYGPLIRFAPWAWGAVYRVCDSRSVMRLLQRTLLALANRPVAAAVAEHQPAAIVSFHPLTGGAAVRARPRRDVPVVIVVTDLVASHAAWRAGDADQMVLPTAAALTGGRRDRSRAGGLSAAGGWMDTGLPVASGFRTGPLTERERAGLRRTLGVGERRFLAVLTGGGEGAGGLARRAAAIVRSFDDVEVVVICGRNRRLRRRLTRLAARAGGQLRVLGFVDNMSDWLHCADVVIAKAGPGTIAEAACCGAPLLLTSHLPGQETGNAQFVTGAGAGLYTPRRGQLLRALSELRLDPTALTAMRAASAGMSRPGAAAGVAAMLAGLTEGGLTGNGLTAAGLTGGGRRG